MANNEQEYPGWMKVLLNMPVRVFGVLNKDSVPASIFKTEYSNYFVLAKSNMQEPLSTFAIITAQILLIIIPLIIKGLFLWNS